MAKMRAPQVPEQPVPVFTDDELAAFLKATDGRHFTSRRDHAIFRLFIDTGMRLGELAGLRVDDLHLGDDRYSSSVNTAWVVGKGNRGRHCPFGAKTSQALDRYLRVRARHAKADRPELWLGERNKGPMTDNGVSQLIRRRGRELGIDGAHAHRFRHTYASQWLSAGGTEGDLMRLAGWRSRQKLSRYGASAADQRRTRGAQAPVTRRPAVSEVVLVEIRCPVSGCGAGESDSAMRLSVPWARCR